MEVHSFFIHVFDKYLLSHHFLPGTVIDTGRQSRVSALIELVLPVGEGRQQATQQIGRMLGVYIRSGKDKETYRGSRILEIANAID